MQKIILVLFFLIESIHFSYANDALNYQRIRKHDIILEVHSGQAIYLTDSTLFHAGDTIWIPAGTYNGITIANLKGSSVHPIVIINKDGRVNIGNATPNGWGITCTYSHWIHITGIGTKGIRNGFYISMGGQHVGIQVGIGVNGFEADHIEEKNVSYFLWVKNDPTCDRATWFNDVTKIGLIDSVHIHDCVFDSSYYEGTYCGGTWNQVGYRVICRGDTSVHFAPHLGFIEIDHNIFSHTGNDAIQVVDVLKKALIHDNIIMYAGQNQRNNNAQANGMSLGGWRKGEVYNNIINHTNGFGVQFIGTSDGVNIHNNVFENTKNDAAWFDGYPCSKLNADSLVLRFYHNKIENSGAAGISLYNYYKLTSVRCVIRDNKIDHVTTNLFQTDHNVKWIGDYHTNAINVKPGMSCKTTKVPAPAF